MTDTEDPYLYETEGIEPCGIAIILADGTLRTVTCQRCTGHAGRHVGYVEGGTRVVFDVIISEGWGEPKSWLREGILP
ncbi:MAG: hypothetical protein KAR22_07895 [Gammaproteobacteria bacterium]|nr:hypothetical protein [Gammaproteobacteria bacterium]